MRRILINEAQFKALMRREINEGDVFIGLKNKNKSETFSDRLAKLIAFWKQYLISEPFWNMDEFKTFLQQLGQAKNDKMKNTIIKDYFSYKENFMSEAAFAFASQMVMSKPNICRNPEQEAKRKEYIQKYQQSLSDKGLVSIKAPKSPNEVEANINHSLKAMEKERPEYACIYYNFFENWINELPEGFENEAPQAANLTLKSYLKENPQYQEKFNEFYDIYEKCRAETFLFDGIHVITFRRLSAKKGRSDDKNVLYPYVERINVSLGRKFVLPETGIITQDGKYAIFNTNRNAKLR